MPRIQYLKCKFCPKICGQVGIPSKFDDLPAEEITLEHLGIMEHRCDDCEQLYGKIQDMKKEYEKSVPNPNNQEFLEILSSCDYKKQGFSEKVLEKANDKKSLIRQKTINSGVNN